MAARAWLIALVAAAIAAAAAQAAPAPLPRPDRHAPTPATLLADLRAAGYRVRGLERGAGPGLYRLTVPVVTLSSEGISKHWMTYAVPVSGADVRAEMRSVLQKQAAQADPFHFDDW